MAKTEAGERYPRVGLCYVPAFAQFFDPPITFARNDFSGPLATALAPLELTAFRGVRNAAALDTVRAMPAHRDLAVLFAPSVIGSAAWELESSPAREKTKALE